MTFIFGAVLFLLGTFFGMLANAFTLAYIKQLEMQKDAKDLRKKFGL